MVELVKIDELHDTIQTTIRFSQDFIAAYVEELGEDKSALRHEMHEIIRVFSTLFQKWTMEIIFLLYLKGAMRFNELKRTLDGISSRTLSRKLVALGENEFVNREIIDQRPVKVTYELTQKGQVVSELAIPQIFFLRFPELAVPELTDDGNGAENGEHQTEGENENATQD